MFSRRDSGLATALLWHLVGFLFVAACLGLLASPALAGDKVGQSARAKAERIPHDMAEVTVTCRTPPDLAEHVEVAGHGGTVKRSLTSIPGHAIRVAALAALPWRRTTT